MDAGGYGDSDSGSGASDGYEESEYQAGSVDGNEHRTIRIIRASVHA